ncbi:MAG: MBL fold metallo-hydrolase [Phycisphaeraceae bacterium]|nr:MAG: MBL fold metallo-hydrolase [Phycisphaeraceae bacterium]
MIPKPPPRESPLGFLYFPPYRVQGLSVAGEATSIQIPELDVCFDMGSCPRAALASKYAAISHGHMDHVGGLAYWCSQRNFQGMGPGTIVCDERIAKDIRGMMTGFVNLERQKTPFELLTLKPGEELGVKNNIALRLFEVEHTCPAVGYVIVEKRTKLKEEFREFPQEKLRELKERGTEIVRHLEVPLVAYLGDTLPGPHLIHDSVRMAKIIVCECTFFEPDHVDRAKVGQHMHVNDIAEWLRVVECEAMVLTHVSRRTNLGYARERLEAVAGDLAKKVFFLMDHRANRARYEEQAAEAERRERELQSRGG